jgi:nucleoside-diphosphate-sugar epimerase
MNPLRSLADGEQSRDFVYISDVVRAWVTALNNEATFGQVLNIGSGRRLTINQLADVVLRVFQQRRTTWDVRYMPARAGEQRHVEADNTRARSLLNWQPRISFETGLEETVRWARDYSSPTERRD